MQLPSPVSAAHARTMQERNLPSWSNRACLSIGLRCGHIELEAGRVARTRRNNDGVIVGTCLHRRMVFGTTGGQVRPSLMSFYGVDHEMHFLFRSWTFALPRRWPRRFAIKSSGIVVGVLVEDGPEQILN